jgi:hypothetical protein
MPRFISILSGFFVLVFLVGLSLAGIPKLINYQGMLTESDGTPLNDTVDMTFKIYVDSTSTANPDKKWEETHSDVPVINGLFNVMLGGVVSLNLDFSEDYWLDVTAGGEHQSERLRFTSVGYAYRAAVADSAATAGSGAGWVDEGTVLRLQTSTDSVGIGTASPTRRLEVKSSGYGDGFSVSSSGGNELFRVRQNSDASGAIYVFGNASDVKAKINGGGGGYITGGDFGVGTDSPNSTLHVEGSVAMAYRYVDSDYTATDSDCIITTGGGYDVHVTLPSAVGIAGRIYTIKQLEGGMDTYIETYGSQTIDGQSSMYLGYYNDYVTLVSNGNNWLIIGKNY